MKFLYSLLGIAFGILILKYSRKIFRFIGKDPDAERIFGGGLGGTHFFIQIFGLGLIIFFMLVLFGYF